MRVHEENKGNIVKALEAYLSEIQGNKAVVEEHLREYLADLNINTLSPLDLYEIMLLADEGIQQDAECKPAYNTIELEILSYKDDIKKLKINDRSNNFISWLFALGVRDIERTKDGEVTLVFRNDKISNKFYKSFGAFIGLESGKKVALDAQQLDLIKFLYIKHIHNSVTSFDLMYINPALKMIKELLGVRDTTPTVAIRDASIGGGNAPIIITKDSKSHLSQVITQLSEMKESGIAFKDNLQALDLCITSYIALNYKLLSSNWIKELAYIHNTLSNSKIENKTAFVSKLNERLRSLNYPDSLQDNDTVFNTIIKYCELLGLPEVSLMRKDLLFAFRQYSDFDKLEESLNASSQKIYNKTYEDICYTLSRKKNFTPSIKSDSSDYTIVAHQYEKKSYPYMHLDEKGGLVIMVPFTGGNTVSTDNTCYSRDSITKFCISIEKVMEDYISDLNKDIQILQLNYKDEQSLIESKNSRLATLTQWQKCLTQENGKRLNPVMIFNHILSGLKNSNAISIAQDVQYPDRIRGFSCRGKSWNPLTNLVKERNYSAAFNIGIAELILPHLKGAITQYEPCTWDSIKNASIKKYQGICAGAQNLSNGDEWESISLFAKCIQEVIQEKVDSDFRLTPTIENREDLEYYRENIWCLEKDDACEFHDTCSTITQHDWESLEVQISNRAFYSNHAPNTFLAMSQIFVNSLTSLYYEDHAIKIDFAEYIQNDTLIENKFCNIVVKSYVLGQSFIEDIVNDIINPALTKVGKAPIDSKAAQKKFKGIFTTINGSPHYDEFLLIPHKIVKDDTANLSFYSFGGNISCSILELKLFSEIEYKKFQPTSDTTEISAINNIEDYTVELKILDCIGSNKTSKEIVDFLLLTVTSDDGKEYKAYEGLPESSIKTITSRPDFVEIKKLLAKKLSQSSYKKLSETWIIDAIPDGSRNLYITPETEFKLYSLYAMKCENEWLRSGDKLKTLSYLATLRSSSARLYGMLRRLDIIPSSNTNYPRKLKDDSTYVLVCNTDKILELATQLANMDNILYLSTNLAEGCYLNVKRHYKGNNINDLNNTVLNDKSKIIITLQTLFPDLDIKPDIAPYNESYNSSIILVNFCANRGFVLKCHDSNLLSLIYETVYSYRVQTSIPKETMLLFVRLIAYYDGSAMDEEHIREAFSRSRIGYADELKEHEDKFILYLRREDRVKFFGMIFYVMQYFGRLYSKDLMVKEVATYLENEKESKRLICSIKESDDIYTDEDFLIKFNEIRKNINDSLIAALEKLASQSTIYTLGNALSSALGTTPNTLNRDLLLKQVELLPGFFSDLKTRLEQNPSLPAPSLPKEVVVSMAPIIPTQNDNPQGASSLPGNSSQAARVAPHTPSERNKDGPALSLHALIGCVACSAAIGALTAFTLKSSTSLSCLATAKTTTSVLITGAVVSGIIGGISGIVLNHCSDNSSKQNR